jgi:hypothetical protein
VNLTNSSGTFDASPSWSPDGSLIAFNLDGDLWTMHTNGSSPTDITNSADYEDAPVWSPDGTKIAFTDNGVDAEIYVMDANGSNRVNVSNNAAYDDNSDWGPAAATPSPTPSPTPTHSPTSTPSPTPTPTSALTLVWGDNDCSSVIDGGDGLLVLIHIAGISAASASAAMCPNLGQQIGFPGGPLWGDVNCSGSIDAQDVIVELRHVAGLDSERTPDCAPIGQEIGPLMLLAPH